jgi:osmotically-inducible protein OsmY
MTSIRYTTNQQLRIAVERELDWTSELDHQRIAVSITDGTVTLSGEVGSYPEKTAATKAALRVRGVTAIVDELVVHHRLELLEDAVIAHQAAQALRHSVVVPPDAVQVAVHDHQVTLSGAVSWHHERIAAAAAVESLPGVRAVRNAIVLAPPVAMVASADARANVTQALLRNAEIEATHIRVDVVGTEVRLTGTVASWAERHQAEHAAWSTPGVTHVDDRIVIEP